jgi:hypothetical protein
MASDGSVAPSEEARRPVLAPAFHSRHLAMPYPAGCRQPSTDPKALLNVLFAEGGPVEVRREERMMRI